MPNCLLLPEFLDQTSLARRPAFPAMLRQEGSANTHRPSAIKRNAGLVAIHLVSHVVRFLTRTCQSGRDDHVKIWNLNEFYEEA